MNQEIWAIAFTPTADGLDVGDASRLFDIGMGSAGWAPTRDGRRFLVSHGVEGRAPGALTVLINWTEALRE